MIMLLSLGCMALVSMVQGKNDARIWRDQRDRPLPKNAKLQGFTLHQQNYVDYVPVQQEDIPLYQHSQSPHSSSQSEAFESDPVVDTHYTVHVKQSQQKSAKTRSRPAYHYVRNVRYQPRITRKNKITAHFVQDIPVPILSNRNQFQDTKQESPQPTESAVDIPKPMSAQDGQPQQTEQPKQPQDESKPADEQTDKESVSKNSENSANKQQLPANNQQTTTVEPEAQQQNDISVSDANKDRDEDLTAENVKNTSQAAKQTRGNHAASQQQKKVNEAGYYTRVRTYIFQRNFNQTRNLILFAAAISMLTVAIYSMILLCCSCMNSKPSSKAATIDESIERTV